MQDTRLLRDIQAVVLDMDGVTWRGDMPLPGLVPFFDFLNERAIPFVLATNNSTSTVSMFVTKLNRLGVDASEANVVTSAVATAAYLRQTYDSDLRVHVLGEAGLIQIMLDEGFPSIMSGADVVVVGMDRDVTYEKLRRATYLIRDGARFIGTNGDRTFPMPDGGVAPGAGSILAALEASTDQHPFVIGKPEPTMFKMSLKRLGAPAANTLMIGDRLETDILGAARVGLRTALVWSGVTTPQILSASSIKPDMTFENLAAIRTAWLNQE